MRRPVSLLALLLAIGCSKAEAESADPTDSTELRSNGPNPFPLRSGGEGLGTRDRVVATPNPTWYFPVHLGPHYPLDDLSRFIEEGERPQCDRDGLVSYRGTSIRYASSIRVNPAFRDRLARLEALVSEVSVAHFGRAPRRLVHHGGYSCRSARGRSYRLSEHALGNAIDVAALDFPRLRRKEALPDGMPRRYRRPFSIRVDRDWNPRARTLGPNAAFLHDLLDRLRERPDIVRGIVGPPHKRHRRHIHLDVAPWRYSFYHYGDTAFVPPPPLKPPTVPVGG